MFGKCKVCEQKELRIEELKAQIEFLKDMLQPSSTGTAVNLEANKILEGSSMPVLEIPDNAEVNKQREDIERERVRIMTGNYYEQYE